MLDQNTDRMWYVIGAVIIGAAIILILNGTMPQIFASVADTFQGKVEETTEITDGIMPQVRDKSLVNPSDIYMDNATLVSYDEVTNTWDMIAKPISSSQPSGMRIIDERYYIPYGDTLTLSYDIFIPEGTEQLSTNNDINNHPLTGYNTGWALNDNDAQNSRLHTGVNAAFHKTPLKSGEWTTVWFSYTNNNAMNVDKLTLFDNSLFGVSNTTGESLPIKIRDVRIIIK